MLNRKFIAALVAAAASSAAFAAPESNSGSSDKVATTATTKYTEGKDACTANVQGTAQQAAEAVACKRYKYPSGGY